ncbi:androgen-induced gene 1 protein [Tetranychus urticae]|uniref:Uncharacterized protein n=1 Tax=Tetranychus urticae TaxID=32264 RepID=T1JUN0_TETUR|nr:androgen-induced gene 1 protein [Tetranychus urticae]
MDQINWIAWRLVSFLVHLMATLVYFYGLVLSEITFPDRVKDSEEPAWAGDWKFLTRWNFMIQLVVFTTLLGLDLAIVGKYIFSRRSDCLDLSGHSEGKQSSIIRRLSIIVDHVIYSLAFPLGVFVTITFWVLAAMGPGTVTSRPTKYILLNHIVHTLVGPTIILELLITSHKRPKHLVKSMFILVAFIICFITWLFFVHFYIDFWLYPILGKLGTVGRIFFIFGCILMLLIFYWIGIAINKLIWTEERDFAFRNQPKPLHQLDTTIMTGVSQNYNPE